MGIVLDRSAEKRKEYVCVKILPLNGSGGKMQHLTKGKALIPFVVVILILSIFMFLTTTKNITRVSAVEAKGVGVYWDSNCSDSVSSIDWGTLSPGSLKSIVVYVRNEEEEQLYLILSPESWNPPEASNYMTLGWNYTGQRTNPNQTVRLTLTLSVSRNIEGISNFSFDIVITGSQRLPGDVNGDGECNILDLKRVKLTYSGLIDDPNADVDNNGEVNILDVKKMKLIYSGIL